MVRAPLLVTLPLMVVLPPKVAVAELFRVNPGMVSVPLLTKVAPELTVTELVMVVVPPELLVKDPLLNEKEAGENVAPL